MFSRVVRGLDTQSANSPLYHEADACGGLNALETPEFIFIRLMKLQERLFVAFGDTRLIGNLRGWSHGCFFSKLVGVGVSTRGDIFNILFLSSRPRLLDYGYLYKKASFTTYRYQVVKMYLWFLTIVACGTIAS